MSIDRVATNQQMQFFLSQLNQAGSALDKTQQQEEREAVPDRVRGTAAEQRPADGCVKRAIDQFLQRPQIHAPVALTFWAFAV